MINKIIVDAGHGGTDPGAIDGLDKNEDDEIYEDIYYTEESNIALFLAAILGEKLKQKYNVIYTRIEDEFISLEKRAEIANNNNADIFISLHANAFSNKNVSGIETLYYPTSSKGKSLANLIQKELIKETEANNRYTKPREKLYVLRKTEMPAVIVEAGFITNPKEEKLLNSSEYLYKQAKAIKEALRYYEKR